MVRTRRGKADALWEEDGGGRRRGDLEAGMRPETQGLAGSGGDDDEAEQGGGGSWGFVRFLLEEIRGRDMRAPGEIERLEQREMKERGTRTRLVVVR